MAFPARDGIFIRVFRMRLDVVGFLYWLMFWILLFYTIQP